MLAHLRTLLNEGGHIRVRSAKEKMPTKRNTRVGSPAVPGAFSKTISEDEEVAKMSWRVGLGDDRRGKKQSSSIVGTSNVQQPRRSCSRRSSGSEITKPSVFGGSSGGGGDGEGGWACSRCTFVNLGASSRRSKCEMCDAPRPLPPSPPLSPLPLPVPVPVSVPNDVVAAATEQQQQQHQPKESKNIQKSADSQESIKCEGSSSSSRECQDQDIIVSRSSSSTSKIQRGDGRAGKEDSKGGGGGVDGSSRCDEGGKGATTILQKRKVKCQRSLDNGIDGDDAFDSDGGDERDDGAWMADSSSSSSDRGGIRDRERIQETAVTRQSRKKRRLVKARHEDDHRPSPTIGGAGNGKATPTPAAVRTSSGSGSSSTRRRVSGRIAAIAAAAAAAVVADRGKETAAKVLNPRVFVDGKEDDSDGDDLLCVPPPRSNASQTLSKPPIKLRRRKLPLSSSTLDACSSTEGTGVGRKRGRRSKISCSGDGDGGGRYGDIASSDDLGENYCAGVARRRVNEKGAACADGTSDGGGGDDGGGDDNDDGGGVDHGIRRGDGDAVFDEDDDDDDYDFVPTPRRKYAVNTPTTTTRNKRRQAEHKDNANCTDRPVTRKGRIRGEKGRGLTKGARGGTLLDSWVTLSGDSGQEMRRSNSDCCDGMAVTKREEGSSVIVCSSSSSSDSNCKSNSKSKASSKLKGKCGSKKASATASGTAAGTAAGAAPPKKLVVFAHHKVPWYGGYVWSEVDCIFLNRNRNK